MGLSKRQLFGSNYRTEPEHAIFLAASTHCAAKKLIRTLPEFESDFGPKIRPDDFFTVTKTLDFLRTQKL
jgi:hypothetical protein